MNRILLMFLIIGTAGCGADHSAWPPETVALAVVVSVVIIARIAWAIVNMPMPCAQEYFDHRLFEAEARRLAESLSEEIDGLHQENPEQPISSPSTNEIIMKRLELENELKKRQFDACVDRVSKEDQIERNYFIVRIVLTIIILVFCVVASFGSWADEKMVDAVKIIFAGVVGHWFPSSVRTRDNPFRK